MCVARILELDAGPYLLTSVALVFRWTVDVIDLRVCVCYCSVLMLDLFGKLFLSAVMRSGWSGHAVWVCISSSGAGVGGFYVWWFFQRV
jgi:hypothetical protein